ncbi:hypothetical protein [Actinoplanes sp. NPDC051859]|uniref:hypothetical protein n=1 Tax=Actinoplanes sp. NPDC051859 TaxID=3363909 RepID=UPI00379D4074
MRSPEKPRRKSIEATCPPGCIEHYTGVDGSTNHATAPRYVTGASATHADHAVTVSTWMEQRHDQTTGVVQTVGIVEKVREDVELHACQIRELAQHLLAVADQVDAAGTAGWAITGVTTVVVSAVSEFVGATPLEVRASTIDGRSVHLHTGTSGEDLMLQPADARELGVALIRAAG